MAGQFPGKLRHIIEDDIPTALSVMPFLLGGDFTSFSKAFDLADIVRVGEVDGQQLFIEDVRSHIMQFNWKISFLPHEPEFIDPIDFPAGFNDYLHIRNGIENHLQVSDGLRVEQLPVIVPARLPLGRQRYLVRIGVNDTAKVEKYEFHALTCVSLVLKETLHLKKMLISSINPAACQKVIRGRPNITGISQFHSSFTGHASSKDTIGHRTSVISRVLSFMMAKFLILFLVIS